MGVKMTRILDLHQRKASQRVTYGCQTQKTFTINSATTSSYVLVQRYITAWRLQNWPYTIVTKSSWFYSNLGYDIQQKQRVEQVYAHASDVE